MARNFIQPGDVLPLTAPSGGVVAGNAYLIGSLLVVAQDTQAQGATFQGKASGVFTLPKATGAGWTEGSKVYWDDSAKKATHTDNSAANKLVGVSVAVAGSADTSGAVRLDGVAR